MFVFPLLLYHHLGYQVSRDTNNRMKLKIKKWQRKSICLLPREDVTNFMFLTFGGKCWIPIILSVFGLLGAISFESGELISHKCPRFAADFPN